LSRFVLDALSFIENDAIPQSIWVNQGTSLCLVGPSIGIVLLAQFELLHFLHLGSQAAEGCDHNVVVLKVSEVALLCRSVMREYCQCMSASLDFLLYLLLPLAKQSYRRNDEGGFAARIIRLSCHEKRQHLNRLAKAHIVSKNAPLGGALLALFQPSQTRLLVLVKAHSHGFWCGNKQLVWHVLVRTNVVEKVVDFFRGLCWIVLLNLFKATSVDIFMAQIGVGHPRAGKERFVIVVVFVQWQRA